MSASITNLITIKQLLNLYHKINIQTLVIYLHHVLQLSPYHHYGSLSPLTPQHSLIFSFCSHKTKPPPQHEQPRGAPHELSLNHHPLPCKHFSYTSTIAPTITYTHCTVVVYVHLQTTTLVHHASLTS